MLFGVWTRVGPKNHVLRGGTDPPCKGRFSGEMAAHCKVYRLCHELCKNSCTDPDAVWDAESGGSREPCIWRGCTLAPPSEYDWTQTVHVQRWCGLMSNYFDHLLLLVILPSVLWRCWLGGRKGIRLVKKTEWWGIGVVICPEWDANDLHMVQLMPLPSHHLLLQ